MTESAVAPVPRPPHLPHADRALSPLHNRLLKRRRPLALSVDGRAATCRLTPPMPWPADALVVDAAVGGEGAALGLAPPLGRRLAADVPLAPDDGGFAALLLEAALAPWLDAAERALDLSFALHRVAPAVPAGVPDLPIRIGVQVRCDDGVHDAVVLLTPPAAAGLAAALDRALPPRPADWNDLPVPVVARLAAVHLLVTEVAGLAPGDVVLPQAPVGPSDGAVLVLAGEWLGAMADRIHQRVRLREALRPLDSRERSLWVMQDEATIPIDEDADGEAASVDELPVRMVFQLGRRDIPLGELRAMGPGHIVDLGRGLEAGVDVFANGRQIGVGELVDLGGQALGVRLMRLFGHGD